MERTANGTHFAACDTGTERVLRDGNLFVDQMIGKVIGPVRHCADKDADRVRVRDRREVLGQFDRGRVERERNLVAVGREVIRDRVLDHLEQLLGPVERPDRQLVQQLDHQASEPFERSRNAHRRVHLNQHASRRVDVHLQPSRLVQRRVE